MKNDQHNQIRTFLYLIQVQAVLYAVISANSYILTTIKDWDLLHQRHFCKIIVLSKNY